MSDSACCASDPARGLPEQDSTPASSATVVVRAASRRAFDRPVALRRNKWRSAGGVGGGLRAGQPPGLADVAAAVGVLLEVVLVVVLGRVERLRGLDLGHDPASVEEVLRGELGDERLRIGKLCVAGRVEARAVLGAVVGALAVHLRRVVHLEEAAQEVAVGDHLGIEDHLHHLGVRAVALGATRRGHAVLVADLLVVGLVGGTLHVAAVGSDDAGGLLEVVLDAPEAAAAEVRGLGRGGRGHRLRRTHFVLAVELERGAVEAEAQARRLRTVVEHMAEMGGAPLAEDLHALHAVRVVLPPADMIAVEGLEEARPARARVELVRAREERQTADDAAVDAVLLVVEQRAAERGLGAGLLRDAVGLGIELLGELLDLTDLLVNFL